MIKPRLTRRQFIFLTFQATAAFALSTYLVPAKPEQKDYLPIVTRRVPGITFPLTFPLSF